MTRTARTDPEGTRRFRRRHNDQPLSRTGMRVLTANEFTLTCTLDLDEYSGAVCVDERQCAFELHAGEWWLWKPPPSSDLPRVPARQLGVAFRDMYESNQESIEFAARP